MATPTWFHRNQDRLGLILGLILLALGTAAIGGLSGYYIGQTKHDATIIAATFTTITAAAGSALGLYQFKQSNFKLLSIIGILMIVYAPTTFVGTKYGLRTSQNEEIRQLFSGIWLRADYLRACADAEAAYDINGYRDILGLPHLSDTTLCK